MLIFDEKKMKKAKVTRLFALEDDDFCVAELDSYRTVDIVAGDEAWVLDLKTPSNEFLFVYFPDVDHATCIRSDLIEME